MSGPGTDSIERTRLPSGLRVLTESMPELRSVAIGFWVGTGGVDEPDELLGASHFLEHLLFKGTETRTASEIAHAVESVGGDMNAFTTQEYTAFYVRVPDDHLAVAADILSAVVWSPAFRPDEVDSERQVILEEIRMRDDTPDDVVHELFAEALFPKHPLGRSVLGTPDTIAVAARDSIAQYHSMHYRPSNVVVAAAGNLEHQQVVDLISGGLTVEDGERPPRIDPSFAPPETVVSERRSTEQAHLVLGVRALARDDPDRYALSVVNQALGGGMSSRLFQEVREKRGLAYSVYSYRVAFDGTGAVGIYAGTSPERAQETLDGRARRARPARGRRSARARARGREGSPQGIDRARARDELQPDAPPRSQRAHHERSAVGGRAGGGDRGGHRRGRRAGDPAGVRRNPAHPVGRRPVRPRRLPVTPHFTRRAGVSLGS